MRRLILAVLMSVAAIGATACGGGGPEQTRPMSRQPLTINGAGATFPYPIYSKWFDEYHKRHPDVQINYQSIGSGGGIRQLLAGTIDFGATDSPMTDEQLAKATSQVLHFPTVLGAIVPSYNLPDVTQPLNFTGAALAGVFLGTVKKWSDRTIATANPGVNLPSSDIVVVHRSDGSGTTFVWTDFLSKVSGEWKSRAGAGTAVSWPVGLGGKGNEGVAGLIKQTPNSVGYVELVYAVQNNLPYGLVQNPTGEFVKADANTVTAAAASVAASIPDDYRVSITNASGKGAYPVASFTWLLIPVKMGDRTKAETMRDFLSWMLTDGQKMAADLTYAPLPPDLVARERETIARIETGT
ncbi:MAG: phosphate ABC transporter substrate-binding protein PstS [Acidobacteria bacterium]|nr:phosphate ABC transporter substrate-binding protein PstS [Acidobacteriota bacterium]